MWLLEQSIRQAIEQAQTTGVAPNVDQQAQFEASRITAQFGQSSRLLTVVGETAKIEVQGVLTKTPSFLAMLFGGGNTTYSEIISALAEADNDENVKNAEMLIDSPGGNVDGLIDTVEAIKNFSKPITVIASNLIASAAYILASQADKIIASNKAVRVGSVGVLFSTRIDDKEISITNTASPKKDPDVTTKAGKAVIVEELDALYNVLVDDIAEGRNITVDEINAKFGQGAVLLADEALKRGMIDSITKSKSELEIVNPTVTNTAANGGDNKTKVQNMNLQELKANHPDLYSAAVEIGANGERDRVTAHLTMGEASGAMDTAVKAIKDGSLMTVTLQAEYMAAGMNRGDTTTRTEDDKAAAAALEAAADGGAGEQITESDDDEIVCSIVEKNLGVVRAA